MYARTEELKNKAYRINRENIKKAIGIQVSLKKNKKNLKKNTFYQNMIVFTDSNVTILNPSYDRNVHTYATN